MNIKPKLGTTAKPLPAVEDDERHRDEVDVFLSRNRDSLNASIKHSRGELAKGNISKKSIDDIIAEGRKKDGS
jgi:dsDNA-binding SOS-regulon protein